MLCCNTDEFLYIVILEDVCKYETTMDLFTISNNTIEKYILIEDILLISQQGLDKLTSINTSDDLLVLMEELVDKIGYDKLAATYEQYNQRENIDRILTSTAELLWQEFTKYDNWTDALNGFTGKDTIPMMTIHKSKGLEYDVVFLLD